MRKAAPAARTSPEARITVIGSSKTITPITARIAVAETLAIIVNTMHDQLAAMRFDVLHFEQGTGHLTDDDQDGIADRITSGTWTAELNLGMGLRHAPATFTATR